MKVIQLNNFKGNLAIKNVLQYFIAKFNGQHNKLGMKIFGINQVYVSSEYLIVYVTIFSLFKEIQVGTSVYNTWRCNLRDYENIKWKCLKYDERYKDGYYYFFQINLKNFKYKKLDYNIFSDVG